MVAGWLRHDKRADLRKRRPGSSQVRGTRAACFLAGLMSRTTPAVPASLSANATHAATNAATPLFMSDEPRPYSLPSSISAANGSTDQGCAPGGTVSRCPVKPSGSLPAAPPMRATSCARPFPKGTTSTANPALSSREASCSAQARSSPGGLMVLKRTRSWVSATEVCMVYPKYASRTS